MLHILYCPNKAQLQRYRGNSFFSLMMSWVGCGSKCGSKCGTVRLLSENVFCIVWFFLLTIEIYQLASWFSVFVSFTFIKLSMQKRKNWLINTIFLGCYKETTSKCLSSESISKSWFVLFLLKLTMIHLLNLSNRFVWSETKQNTSFNQNLTQIEKLKRTHLNHWKSWRGFFW